MEELAASAFPVPASLRPWILGIDVTRPGGPDAGRTVISAPDHATTLAYRAIDGQGGDLLVMGPRTRALYHAGKPGVSCLRFRIQPGRARAILGGAVSELVDRVVPLEELWGESAQRLARELLALGPGASGVGRLGEVIVERLSRQRAGDLLRSDVAHGAATLLSAVAVPRAERVLATARRLNVSERHLRTLFVESVGVSPMHFARIDRVRTVLARAGHAPWAGLATEVGYYDQSHLTADFRQIMGVPPGAFFSGRRPAATPCRDAHAA